MTESSAPVHQIHRGSWVASHVSHKSCVDLLSKAFYFLWHLGFKKRNISGTDQWRRFGLCGFNCFSVEFMVPLIPQTWIRQSTKPGLKTSSSRGYLERTKCWEAQNPALSCFPHETLEWPVVGYHLKMVEEVSLMLPRAVQQQSHTNKYRIVCVCI